MKLVDYYSPEYVESLEAELEFITDTLKEARRTAPALCQHMDRRDLEMAIVELVTQKNVLTIKLQCIERHNMQ